MPPNEGDWTPTGMANVLWGFATLGVWHAALLQKVAQELLHYCENQPTARPLQKAAADCKGHNAALIAWDRRGLLL